MATLLTAISLDHLHCHKESDTFGVDEPYLWTAFFKIDGDTVVLDLIGEGPDEDLTIADLYLRGTCTFVTTGGSHGNLGDTDVAEGDDVAIPSELGESAALNPLQWTPTLKPIPVTARAKAKLLEKVDQVEKGAIGVVVALMEEQSIRDDSAEAGHMAFNRTLEDGINAFLYQEGRSKRREDLEGKILGLTLPELTPEQKAALKAKVRSAAEDAIIKAEGIDPRLLDADIPIDSKDFIVEHEAFVGGGVEIDEHFQHVGEVNGAQVVLADYKLFGDILGIEPSPLGHAALRRSHEHGTPPAAGAPTAYVHPGLGVENIIYRDTDGRLHELWRDASGKTGTTNLTDNANAPTAEGNPFAYVDSNGVQHIVVYRGEDRHVHGLSWSTGPVHHDNLTGAVGAEADGNPVGYFTPATNTNHVIYRTRDGHLHVLAWAGADDPVHHEDMTAWAGAPDAVGDPSAYVDTTHGENVVVYRGADRHIYSLHWRTDTPFQHEDLLSVAETPLADGDAVAYYIAGADMNQVTYRSGTSLFELSWVGVAPVKGGDLTAASGAPPALSDPAVYYNGAANTKHVVYRSANNHLYEISWALGSTTMAVVDLTLMGLARRAVDKPAAYIVDGPNTQHVIYRSADNEIREISWNRAVTEPVLPTGPAAQGDDMQPGEVLNPGQAIASANGRYRFIYQGDGNLVLYDAGTPLWASNTAGRPVGVCIIQKDGNLVVYDPTVRPIWSSDTWQHPGSRLVVQDDGNVVIYRPDGTPVWATNTAVPVGPAAQGDDMQPGEVLGRDLSISSASGRYRFIYQGDGNLVLYDGGTPLWASVTHGRPVGVCIMQGDGNLVIYVHGGQPIWSSDTWQHPGSRLVVQDDGNVVIYRPDGTPVWATNTWLPFGPAAEGDDMRPGEILNPGQAIASGNGRFRFIYQGDGNLVLYDGGAPLWASGTDGKPVGVCIMQGDGNLVIYARGGQPIWSSDTWQHPGGRLVVQDDGNVVIYRPDGTPVWATNTVQP